MVALLIVIYNLQAILFIIVLQMVTQSLTTKGLDPNLEI